MQFKTDKKRIRPQRKYAAEILRYDVINSTERYSVTFFLLGLVALFSRIVLQK